MDIEVPPVLESMHDLNTRIEEFSKRQGIPATIVNGVILLILEEIFVNIVSYSECPEDEPVRIRIDRTGDELWMEFEYGGVQFDPTRSREVDTTAPLEERDIGGLGIFFVRELSESFVYERRDEKNILRIKIKGDGHGAGSQQNQ